MFFVWKYFSWAHWAPRLQQLLFAECNYKYCQHLYVPVFYVPNHILKLLTTLTLRWWNQQLFSLKVSLTNNFNNWGWNQLGNKPKWALRLRLAHFNKISIVQFDLHEVLLPLLWYHMCCCSWTVSVHSMRHTPIPVSNRFQAQHKKPCKRA